MTEKIRDYNVNGAMIIGVDNGYGNMKTARRCFKTALAKYDSEPVLSRDYLEYEGKFYVIGEGHKGFVADKQSDEDNYILTLTGIVKELESCKYPAIFASSIVLSSCPNVFKIYPAVSATWVTCAKLCSVNPNAPSDSSALIIYVFIASFLVILL